MKLWLLRHGEAEPYQAQDAERQLTDRGRAQVMQAADVLQGVRLDAVIASPYVRAQQTTDIVLEQLRYPEAAHIAPWLTPEKSVVDAPGHIEAYGVEHILLIGHQPLLGNLASWLCDGTQQGTPLGTGSLFCLEGDCLVGAMQLVLSHHASC